MRTPDNPDLTVNLSNFFFCWGEESGGMANTSFEGGDNSSFQWIN